MISTAVEPGRRRHRILGFLQSGAASLDEIRAAVAKPDETRRSTRTLVRVAIAALHREGLIRIARGQHSLTDRGEQLLAQLAQQKDAA